MAALFVTSLRCEACGDMFNDWEAAEAHNVGAYLEGEELREWIAEGHRVVDLDDPEEVDPDLL